MSNVRFIELQILADESRSNTERQCASILSHGKHCEEQISRATSKTQQLHDKLRDDKDLDTAARREILEEIAKLSLCDVHAEDEDIDAAVKQWESEIASRTTPEEPQTPKPKSGANSQRILFQASPKAKKLENPLDLDAEVRRVLAGNIEIQDKKETSLYIFSYKHAPGVYKFGKTNHLDRRTGEHEKCYPGLEMRIKFACPNAGLFERVVHAELSRYRRFHFCDRCGKRHIEWFEAPLKTIRYVATAWSLYAAMLYEHGLSVDANHQRLPLRGFSTREDRWCRWALGEAIRWMDKNPDPTASLPKIPVLAQVNEMDDTDASGSEAESTFSSPASLADTPGTTPASSPGSYGDENDDYGLSPSPAERYTKVKPAGMVKEDEGDNDDDNDLAKETEKPTKRALFPSKKAENGLSQERARSMDIQSLQPSKEDTAADADTNLDPKSNSSFENGSSTSTIDVKIRSLLLDRSPHLTKNHGTIYLTAHAEKSSYKIFNRGLGRLRKNSQDCYSQPAPAFAITCTDKVGIQNLVLAQFKDSVERDTCGYDGCSGTHFNWINAPLDDIKARLRAWTELLEVGYDTVDIPEEGFSHDEDRWTKWAKDTVAAARCVKETRRKERKDKDKNRNEGAKSKGHKAGKAREEEPPSDSDEESASVGEPRRNPRAPSNSPSDRDFKTRGDVRPSMIRRMSTKIEQTGKAQMSRVSSFKDKGKKGFGKIVEKLK